MRQIREPSPWNSFSTDEIPFELPKAEFVVTNLKKFNVDKPEKPPPVM